jgi:uncharacterized protein (DUF983 family)
MNIDHKQASIFWGIIGMKCPECRTGQLFANKSIFPLKEILKMNETCPNCHQKLKTESNNGPGINYALTVILLFLNIFWYYPIFGLSYKDNSIFYFLAASTLVVILLQPFLMRISRVLYLYILLSFKDV